MMSNSTVRKIVSGGQTGADQAALDFALAAGLEHGGWVPKGRTDERGSIPERFDRLIECTARNPAVRTRLNVRDSDGTAILSHGALQGGSRLTESSAVELGKPCLHLDLAVMSEGAAAAKLAEWIGHSGIVTLNVAGPRASQDGAIAGKTRTVLELAFGTDG